MDLIFLDADFNIIAAPADDYTSFTWGEKWYTTGSFTLYLPSYRFNLLRYAKYIYNQDKDECAKITSITYTESDKSELVVGGVMLESILHKRVIDTEITLNSTVENAAYSLVTQFALTGDRIIPLLELAPLSGFTEPYDGTVTAGTFLDTCLYDLLKPHGMTYRIKYDFYNNKLIFSVVKGLDRSQDQEDNNRAIFSTDFENLGNISYSNSDEDFKNFAYVTGTINGVEVTETVDQTDGGDRFEIYLKPSFSSDENVTRAVLKQRGAEMLAEYPFIENVSGDVDVHGSLVYGIDYNIGDMCDVVVAKLGMTWSAQITEVDHVYESSGYRIIPRFGEDKLNIRRFIEREMKN